MISYSDDFLGFWKSYPRRISKTAAFKSYSRAMKNGVTPEKILSAVENYKKWLAGSGWRPEPKHASTWLNQGCWEDEYEAEESKPAPFKTSQQNRLDNFYRTGYWMDAWGDKPPERKKEDPPSSKSIN